MVKDDSLYNILEVDPSSTEQEIKKSYNRLSRIWHPDKHPDKELAHSKFQEINKAKEILLDSEKRALYDQIGMDIFNNNMQESNGDMPDFGNMFNQGFPFNMGGFPGMPNFRQKQETPEHIINNIDITLEQIYNEESINYTYNQKHYCTKCNGEGTHDGKSCKCLACDGKGIKLQIHQMGPMIQQMVGQCNICNGTGTIINEKNRCDICSGLKYITKDKTIQIPLKRNLAHGNRIEITGKGNQFKNYKTNLILIVNELPNDRFKRYNNDLLINVNLKLYQALFGFNKVIEHLDNSKLHISCSSKTEYNTVRKINSKGINGGDLYIIFTFELPNLINLPNDTQQHFKSVMQSFDKQEVIIENEIIKDTTLIKTICNDCKNDLSKKIIDVFNNFKPKKPDIHSHKQQEFHMNQEPCNQS